MTAAARNRRSLCSYRPLLPVRSSSAASSRLHYSADGVSSSLSRSDVVQRTLALSLSIRCRSAEQGQEAEGCASGPPNDEVLSADQTAQLRIGFPSLTKNLDNTGLVSALCHIRSFTCDASTRQTFIPVCTELYHLKHLRLLAHADDGWVTQPRRPVFSLETCYVDVDIDNSASPSFFDWLLSQSRFTLRSLRVGSSHGADAMAALRSAGETLQHLRLDRVHRWPSRRSLSGSDDGRAETFSVLIETLPDSLLSVSLSPLVLPPVEADDLAQDLLDALPNLPNLRKIGIGGALTDAVKGGIEATIFFTRCADAGVQLRAI